MDREHILKAFDRDLNRLNDDLVRMGGLVEAAIGDALTALERRDLEMAEEVRRNDRRIDDLEHRLQEEVARVIALRAPTAGDLRRVLSALKTAGSLERIGDYAKNVAKRTQVIARDGIEPEILSAIKRMGREVQLMLKDVLDALVREDAVLAEDVRHRDEEIDRSYNAIFRLLLTYMMENPRRITPAMHMHFVAKNLERIGDLVTNIAEQVIYMTTGEMPEEERPKADITSTDATAEKG